MYKNRLLTFLGVITLATTISSTPVLAARGEVTQFYQGESIDDMVIKFMQENNIPGLSLAIVQAPYIPRVVGYGLADTETKRLISTNTVFNLGQITTAYTAVAIMQLVEEGKLSLNDNIAKFIPNLPKEWQGITVNQLMSHSSGLPDYTKAANFNYSQTYTPTQIIDLIKNTSVHFKAGSKTTSSASNFYLLGMIIEKASGISYEDYVTKNQFERLGLKHTFFVSNINTIQNETNNKSQPFKHEQFKHGSVYINPTEPATGYTEINNALAMVKSQTQTAGYANASIYASSQDVSFWDIGLAGDVLVKDPKHREYLYKSISLDNGEIIPGNVGWNFPGRPGLMFIEGNVPGFTSFLSRFTDPKELVCVTLLANKDNVRNFEILGRKIAATYDEKLGAPIGAPWSVTRQSPYPVGETIDRFVEAVKQQGGKIFARIDHSEEAQKAGQTLTPMQVVIIGNPSKGTGLMQASNQIALELPLRALAWRDSSGQVWLSFTNPVELGKAYHVQGQDQLLKQMYFGLSDAAKAATTSS